MTFHLVITAPEPKLTGFHTITNGRTGLLIAPEGSLEVIKGDALTIATKMRNIGGPGCCMFTLENITDDIIEDSVSYTLAYMAEITISRIWLYPYSVAKDIDFVAYDCSVSPARETDRKGSSLHASYYY